MADTILTFILVIPLYVVLIWTYYCPEDSMLFGQRWMYKDEPEFSDDAIRYTKFVARMGLLAITMFLVLSFIENFVVRILLIMGFIFYVIYGGYRLLKKYLDS